MRPRQWSPTLRRASSSPPRWRSTRVLPTGLTRGSRRQLEKSDSVRLSRCSSPFPGLLPRRARQRHIFVLFRSGGEANLRCVTLSREFTMTACCNRVAPSLRQTHLSASDVAAHPHQATWVRKYFLQNSNRALSVTGRGPKRSPSSITTGESASKAAQAGSPAPFGLPVAAKLAQKEAMLSAILLSAAVQGWPVAYGLSST